MYIRLLSFQTNGNKKTEVATIMDDIMPKIRSQNGCKDCKFMMHESDDHYAPLVFWESKKQADTAAEIIGPQLLPALNRITKENLIHRLYEEYQPEAVLV